MLVRFIIVVLCISVQIAVYLQTRKYLKATVRSSAINSQVRVIILKQFLTNINGDISKGPSTDGLFIQSFVLIIFEFITIFNQFYQFE